MDQIVEGCVSVADAASLLRVSEEDLRVSILRQELYAIGTPRRLLVPMEALWRFAHGEDFLRQVECG